MKRTRGTPDVDVEIADALADISRAASLSSCQRATDTQPGTRLQRASRIKRLKRLNRKKVMKMTYTTSTTKVITGPATRFSYVSVLESKSINGLTPKHCVSLIIPRSDTETGAKIETAIKVVYENGQGKLMGNGKSVPALASIKMSLRGSEPFGGKVLAASDFAGFGSGDDFLA